MKKTESRIVDDLGAIPLFEGLDKKHLAGLAGIAAERKLNRGEAIFQEGGPCTSFFVCLKGRIKVFKMSPDGKEQILHVIGPNEPFGEVPMFEGGRYPAHAAALEACRILSFPRDAFVALIGRDPSVALAMLAILSRRLRRFTNLVEDLSLKEVPGRLAAYLLFLSERNARASEAVLETSRGQLASLLGTIPETLSRILTKMSAEGLIRSKDNRTIQLLDRDGLQALAAGETRLT